MSPQYILPPRRKPQRSGIERAVQRRWPKHERWVRGHNCVVPGCESREIEFMHLRSAANAGTGLKPHSAFGISGCHDHHAEAHRIGHASFARKYGIDLWAMAAEFVRRSPDVAMKESLKLIDPHSPAGSVSTSIPWTGVTLTPMPAGDAEGRT